MLFTACTYHNFWSIKNMNCKEETPHTFAFFCIIYTVNSWSTAWTFSFANGRQNSLSTHMISQPPLTNSSSDLIPGSKRQKNLYLNLVHFNSTPEVPWEKNWIKVRQADSTAWKMNLSRCFWNMYLPCARAGVGRERKKNVIGLHNSPSTGEKCIISPAQHKNGACLGIY